MLSDRPRPAQRRPPGKDRLHDVSEHRRRDAAQEMIAPCSPGVSMMLLIDTSAPVRGRRPVGARSGVTAEREGATRVVDVEKVVEVLCCATEGC